MSTQLILRASDAPTDETSLVPSFMQEDRELVKSSTEELGQFIYPPRVKIIQSNASEAYSQFTPGSVILAPQGVVIAELEEPFYFVPLLFYPEWITINPYELKGTLPMIRERSFDPRSTIARKARNPETRREKFPDTGNHEAKHTEFLTFICLIVNDERVTGMPVVLSFSSGSHRDGAQLSSLITMRRAPLFGCVFQGVVPAEKRKHAKGNPSYVIIPSNPDESNENAPAPFVQDRDTYEQLKALHLKLKASQSSILAQYDDDDLDVEGSTMADAEGKF